jgi:cob(I)alamin adenosyltransferase
LNKIASSAAKRIAEVSSMLDEVKRVIADANGGLSKEEKETAKIYRERIKRIEGLKDLAAKAMGLAAKIL